MKCLCILHKLINLCYAKALMSSNESVDTLKKVKQSENSADASTNKSCTNLKYNLHKI